MSDGPFCPAHPGEELVAAPAGRPTRPETPDPAEQPRRVCWRCGETSPNRAASTCVHCHESLVPPTLVVDFPDGSVVIRGRGRSVEVGRAGGYGHVFARYPNVSRRHATIGVDERGDAWIEPIPSAPNGTFVNDREIFRRTPLTPGDRIRFAADRGPHVGPTSRRIRQPYREPETGPVARESDAV